MPSPSTPTNADVSMIIDRRDQSRKWFRDNLYDELTEVYRSIKCKTKPINKKDAAGNDTNEEDKSRTNVKMPTTNIAYRKNVARMTAQPYRLRYRGGSDPNVAAALSALAIQQYDRSKERVQDRRLVMQGEAFGFGYSKLYWDRIARTMVFRQAIMKGDQVVMRDRASIMRAQGAGQDEIQGAVQELGPEMDDNEIADFIGRTGQEVTVPKEVSPYEGPCLKVPFIGDIFLEPGCLGLQDSNFVIEQYKETDLWLKKMEKLTYKNDDGQWVPAFDPEALQGVLDSSPSNETDKRVDDLRNAFEASIGRRDEQQSSFAGRLRPRKKFDIIEQHEVGEDGRIWVTFASERYRDKPLGRFPYPWDLYGQYSYTEYIPLPDLIGCWGDSTPRLMRYIQSMHDLTVAQNFDYVTNVLKVLFLKKAGSEINAEIVTRGNMRVMEVEDLNCIKALETPQLPSGAMEREAQILRMAALLEPALNTTDTGTAGNPMAGKLATTAILNAKASDALLQFKLDGRDMYLQELGQKKLWMNQQMQQDAWEINEQFWNDDLRQAVDNRGNAPLAFGLSERNGRVAAVRIDPLEIQEDLQVEPEAGSYLAIDDELRRSAAMDLDQVALAAPDVVDRRKVIRFHLSTIRGIGNPDDYIIPEQPADPVQEVKKSVSFNFPMDKMPADIVNQALPMLGMQPSEELAHRDTVDGVSKIADAANKLGNAAQPANPPEEEKMGNPKQAAATK